MAKLCAAYKADGGACGNIAGPTGFCRHHRPRTVFQRVLPKHMLRDYLSHIPASGDITSMHAETQVIQALIAQAVEGLETRNCQASWQQLAGLAKEYGAAQTEQRKVQIAAKMCGQIQIGSEIWKQTELLLEYMEFKRKLAEHEQKRIKMAEDTLDAKQVAAMTAKVLEAIEKHVPDPAVRRAIGEEIVACRL